MYIYLKLYKWLDFYAIVITRGGARKNLMVTCLLITLFLILIDYLILYSRFIDYTTI